MPVWIKEKEGFFEVSGTMDTENCFQVCKFFEILLNMKGDLRIDISKLESLDMDSIRELNTLVAVAAQEGSTIEFITTRANKKSSKKQINRVSN
ncbi:hypothetical protein [Christiangramia salexigens]|uniref:STAS domain-containing protein n=1 Tax=Christiangramia salexigens TaxID=1913577 RepID=A0A1L3J6B7_9FLAO|nr:hypothetical protein [Christiangramia salexigens]APG60640.1 hypothetical protein LPB144_09595 [Christiangramia salexigens]